MTPDEQNQLFGNIAAAMASVPEAIQRRQIELFLKVDPDYGRGVAERLGLESISAAAE
jgi:catalase